MTNLFNTIADEYSFSTLQRNQYIQYINFLQEENKKYNLTRIDQIDKILYYHFIDALFVTKFNLFNKLSTIVDVGSGCGVPGILLAILYQDKKFYLIEVVKKKINFLKECISLLGLLNCTVIEDDFLTFLYRNNNKIDYFIGRASLGMSDFIKIYKLSQYRNSEIVYWASLNWKNDFKHSIILNHKNLIIKEYFYVITEEGINKNLTYVHIKNK